MKARGRRFGRVWLRAVEATGCADWRLNMWLWNKNKKAFEWFEGFFVFACES